MSISNSWNVLQGDPLTSEDKQQIQKFVNSYLLTGQTVSYWSSGPRTRPQNIFEDPSSNFFFYHDEFSALSKVYAHDPKKLEMARITMGDKKFNEFRHALQHPEVLNINKSSLAVQKYMQAAILGLQKNLSEENVQALYRKKMAQRENESQISGKNQLLLENAPAYSGHPRNLLEVVLANTHARTSQATIGTVTSQMPGQEPVIIKQGTTYRCTKEQTLAAIRKEFGVLYNNESTKHVIEALGTVILQEKGKIFFGSQTGTIDRDLENPRIINDDTLMLGGFYNKKHAVFLKSILIPRENPIVNDNVISYFVHESLHFIFDRIVKNKSSPVIKGSTEETLLDVALQSDREHRKTLRREKLTESQLSIHIALVGDLEEQKIAYFPGGFDTSNANHLHTMRVEAIVRVMQEIVNGATEADFAVVAPHLYQFYMTVSKPMIEEFIQKNKTTLDK